MKKKSTQRNRFRQRPFCLGDDILNVLDAVSKDQGLSGTAFVAEMLRANRHMKAKARELGITMKPHRTRPGAEPKIDYAAVRKLSIQRVDETETAARFKEQTAAATAKTKLTTTTPRSSTTHQVGPFSAPKWAVLHADLQMYSSRPESD